MQDTTVVIHRAINGARVDIDGRTSYDYVRFELKRLSNPHSDDYSDYTFFKSDHDMVLELEPGIINKISGLVDYPELWHALI